MKKLVVVLAILFANGLFTSCTELEDEEQEVNPTEIQNTGGEDGQLPDDDEDEDEDDETLP